MRENACLVSETRNPNGVDLVDQPKKSLQLSFHVDTTILLLHLLDPHRTLIHGQVFRTDLILRLHCPLMNALRRDGVSLAVQAPERWLLRLCIRYRNRTQNLITEDSLELGVVRFVQDAMSRWRVFERQIQLLCVHFGSQQMRMGLFLSAVQCRDLQSL